MAETTFKKIAFENLSESQKAQMAANAASFTQVVRDEAGRPVIDERTGRVETYIPTAEEYYNIRGGVNRSGYFGDAYRAAEQSRVPYLTEEEYSAVIADLNARGVKGTSRGTAINIATAKGAFDKAKARGLSDEQATIESGFNPYTGETATISEVINPKTGNPELVFVRGDSYIFADGSSVKVNNASVVSAPGFGDSSGFSASLASQAAAEAKRAAGQSAYNLLLEQFNQYGLGALVAPLQALIVDGLSPAEFTLRLRDTDAYKKRFAANQARIQRGLRALSEAEYIGLEDQYQNIMRNYGLPASYYTRGDMGRQEGFEKFISGDVSAAELEDRIQTAQNRVINAAPEVSRALREFYPGITNGDILAYALDPDKAITDIRRKVTAAEIGAGAMQAGLATGVARAEELQRFGVTGEQARAGFQAISDILPRGRQLSEIYGRQGVGPYTQTTAEQEVFGLTGAAEAGRQRRKLTELEQAAFSGQAGAAGGALARDRAGAF